MSYNGSMDFGLLGDYDAMHDLDAFGEMVDDSLKEMVTAAKRRRASNGQAKPRPKRAAKNTQKTSSSGTGKPGPQSKTKSAQ